MTVAMPGASLRWAASSRRTVRTPPTARPIRTGARWPAVPWACPGAPSCARRRVPRASVRGRVRSGSARRSAGRRGRPGRGGPRGGGSTRSSATSRRPRAHRGGGATARTPAAPRRCRRDVEVRVVLDICRQRLAAGRRPPAAAELQPGVPVGQHREGGIEAADRQQRLAAGEHRRGGADRVRAEQRLAHPVGIRGLHDALEDERLVGDDLARVGDLSATLGQRVQLSAALVRRPQVVVVEQRHPTCARLLDADVARRRDAPAWLAQDRHARIRQRLGALAAAVGGAVVDHQHLQLHVPLGERAGECSAQERPAVAGWDDDRELDCHPAPAPPAVRGTPRTAYQPPRIARSRRGRLPRAINAAPFERRAQAALRRPRRGHARLHVGWATRLQVRAGEREPGARDASPPQALGRRLVEAVEVEQLREDPRESGPRSS